MSARSRKPLATKAGWMAIAKICLPKMWSAIRARPVAISATWRRWAAKVVACQLSSAKAAIAGSVDERVAGQGPGGGTGPVEQRLRGGENGSGEGECREAGQITVWRPVCPPGERCHCRHNWQGDPGEGYEPVEGDDEQDRGEDAAED